MSDYEHGDKVTVELEATVIEQFEDGDIDVNLDNLGECLLGGINLVIPPGAVSDDA